MIEVGSIRKLVPQSVRELPADLAVVGAVIVATDLTVVAAVFRESPVRILLGLVFVLFAPGYAFVAALFPEERPASRSEAGRESERTEYRLGEGVERPLLRSGVTGLERAALSMGLSIAIAIAIGLAFDGTPLGVRSTPIVLAVSLIALGSTGVAAVRRAKLPAQERFRVPFREWATGAYLNLLEPETGTDAVLNVFIVIALIAALGSGGYVTMAPTEDEQFSAVYLLTEDDSGDLVADEYPTEFERGERSELVVGVDNNEHRPMTYSIVVVEQTVATDGNETVVTEQNELDRFERRLSHDETWRFRYDLEPTLTGENVRIAWLLYSGGTVPAAPSLENADSSAYLWTTVSED